ncbi:glycoside hydrolase family 6 protein, partial [Streptomyces sp. NPDC005534]
MKRRTPTWLAALSLSLAALFAVPPAHAAEASDAAGRGPALYVPDANPAAYRQALDLARAGRLRDAAGILTMVNTPQAVWFGDQTPAEVERQVREVVRDAGRDDATAVLALYDIPGRDCSNYSA